MANYYAYARTNYFKVKDVEKFKAFCETLPGVEFIEKNTDKNLVGFICDGEVGLPSFTWDEEANDENEIDLEQEIAKHLIDGEVAVLVEAGHEKLRYVTGYAVAVNSKGETRNIGIENIYELAMELGNNVTRAEY